MAWLLFLDESGHDHKQVPYEVRGGIALQDSRLWSFTQAFRRLEEAVFGGSAVSQQIEIKGSTLLDRKRFRFAGQAAPLPDSERLHHCRAFLSKSRQQGVPTFLEFCAYGQSCLLMARQILRILKASDAVLFASMIPRGSGKAGEPTAEFLRKDQVFLLERFSYFLQQQGQQGLLVLDSTEKSQDRKFVRQLEAYFEQTVVGRQRSRWIVPTPLFVSSDMAYPIQAADLCIYCLNWGFRLPEQGMTEPVRPEIEAETIDVLKSLQYHGFGERAGRRFETWGVCFVPNPCAPGRQ